MKADVGGGGEVFVCVLDPCTLVSVLGWYGRLSLSRFALLLSLSLSSETMRTNAPC